MDIFGAVKPGLVRVAQAAGGSSGIVGVSGPGGDLTGLGPVVVTSFNVRLAVNNQYAPALDKSVYVYGFGDRAGTLSISGLTFSRMCGQEGGEGLDKVLRFYGASRAIADVTISMSVEGNTFRGFLDKADVGADNPEFHVGRFTLEATTLPAMMGI
jgi:hypothetical protein